MSTYIYLVCQDHNPPLRADFGGESGQHLYDLPQLRQDVADKDVLLAAYDRGVYPSERYRSNTVDFLAYHRTCTLGIKSEYGDAYAIDGDSQEPLDA